MKQILVHQALQLTNISAAVHIEKNIPAGGGLGGGSTDAAGVLRWAGFTDLVAASAIGADIAFCMVGGNAQVTGIGEIITPLAPLTSDITLIIPPLHVSTALVYAAWDELKSPHHESGNDLEPAAIAVCPDLCALEKSHHRGARIRSDVGRVWGNVVCSGSPNTPCPCASRGFCGDDFNKRSDALASQSRRTGYLRR